MKRFSFSVLLCVFLVGGCAHNPHGVSSLDPPVAAPRHQQVAVASQSEQNPLVFPEEFAKSANENPNTVSDLPTPAVSPEVSAKSVRNNFGVEENFDDFEEESEGEKAGIADPLEPFNRAMYHFNDKLYFWVLKPVAQGYKKIVPEPARVGVGNLFSNISFPIRFVNCLLQANFGGAAREFGRFMINTLWGVGGFLDPASSKDINLAKQDEDFGQTLGVYGLGHGFYINWPIFGPSSPRDTVGMIGDFFLHPFAYTLNPWDVSAGVRAYEKVNDTSLKIGDYESLKEAAIDPYVAFRDAYVQYRLNKVKSKGVKSAPSRPDGVTAAPKEEASPAVE